MNFASIRKLKDLKLINTCESHEASKWHVCVESKCFKKPYKHVMTRSIELLELIHSDLVDFKNTPSSGVRIVMYLLLMTSLNLLRFTW